MPPLPELAGDLIVAQRLTDRRALHLSARYEKGPQPAQKQASTPHLRQVTTFALYAFHTSLGGQPMFGHASFWRPIKMTKIPGLIRGEFLSMCVALPPSAVVESLAEIQGHNIKR